MKALTVQQPWAWAIFHGKNIENRTQLWRYRGPLAIHAGQRWSERGERSPLVGEAMVAAESTQHVHTCRVILGIVELVDVHYDANCCRPWGESAYEEHGGRTRKQVVHLVLENARLLPKPIPCRGALGLWTPPADILEQLAAVANG